MRLAIDATSLVGEQTGVGVFTTGAINGLAARGDVDLVAFAVSWRARRTLAGAVPPGVRTGRLPLAAGPLHRVWQRVDAPVIEWWTGRVDVVHGTNFVVPPAGRAAEVVTVHDLTPIRFPELCEPATLRFPDLIRRALRRGAWVHTVSQTIADEVVQLLGAAKERVRVVPCGVDGIDGVDGVDGVVGPGGAERTPYVLALAKTEPRKDLPGLVMAFDQMAGTHPDLELVIAGPRGWAEDELVGAIARARHRDRVKRLGWVGGRKKLALLRGAAVFAYPSLYEGFGLPPLEAMTVGVPVVATDARAVREVVGEAGKLVPVGDSGALAAALAHVLDDEAERAYLIDAGRRRAAEFTWERCASGLYDLYRDAMALKAG